MNTININKADWKTETLKDYAILLLNNGFRVFVYIDNQKISYFMLSKEEKIGYVQLKDFGGFQFSTKHKPNRERKDNINFYFEMCGLSSVYAYALTKKGYNKLKEIEVLK